MISADGSASALPTAESPPESGPRAGSGSSRNVSGGSSMETEPYSALTRRPAPPVPGPRHPDAQSMNRISSFGPGGGWAGTGRSSTSMSRRIRPSASLVSLVIRGTSGLQARGELADEFVIPARLPGVPIRRRRGRRRPGLRRGRRRGRLGGHASQGRAEVAERSGIAGEPEGRLVGHPECGLAVVRAPDVVVVEPGHVKSCRS